MALIVLPLALVLVTVCVDVRALPVHLSIDPLANVAVAVRVCQRSEAVDAAVNPLGGRGGGAGGVGTSSRNRRQGFLPYLSLIHVAVRVDTLALSLDAIVVPLALVAPTVEVVVDAKAVALAVHPAQELEASRSRKNLASRASTNQPAMR